MSTERNNPMPAWIDEAALAVAKQLVQVLAIPPAIKGGRSQWTAQLQCLVGDAIQSALASPVAQPQEERELPDDWIAERIREELTRVGNDPDRSHLDGNAYAGTKDEIIALFRMLQARAATSQDAVDAARYRWLRDNADSAYVDSPYVVRRIYREHLQEYVRVGYEPQELDIAVDAAIAAMQAQGAKE